MELELQSFQWWKIEFWQLKSFFSLLRVTEHSWRAWCGSATIYIVRLNVQRYGFSINAGFVLCLHSQPFFGCILPASSFFFFAALFGVCRLIAFSLFRFSLLQWWLRTKNPWRDGKTVHALFIVQELRTKKVRCVRWGGNARLAHCILTELEN